jgi:SOS-response transcriptional repressor LexA
MSNFKIIKELAEGQKMTIRSLASRIGMTAESLHALIKKGSTNTSTLEAIANELGVPTGIFFESGYTTTDVNRKDPPSIPLYNWDVVAGMDRFPDVVDESQHVEMFLPFPGARSSDFCIRVTGDSMTPTYKPGSIILVREVAGWREYFGYGNVFVIALSDGRRIFKEIQRYDENPEKSVLCVSHNRSYPAEELPKNLITRVFKLVSSLTEEGF